MQVSLCKAKLNKARVTGCNRDYSGSLAVDWRVLRDLRVFSYERVLVVNRDRGMRFETYVVPGREGTVELQGGAALLGEIGDTIGFLAFAIVGEDEVQGWSPRVVELEPDGTITRIEAAH